MARARENLQAKEVSGLGHSKDPWAMKNGILILLYTYTSIWHTYAYLYYYIL